MEILKRSFKIVEKFNKIPLPFPAGLLDGSERWPQFTACPKRESLEYKIYPDFISLRPLFTNSLLGTVFSEAALQR